MAKLSDLIELGSVLIGESHGYYYRADTCRGCAIGAAGIAAGITATDMNGMMSFQIYDRIAPFIESPTLAISCPVCTLLPSEMNWAWKSQRTYSLIAVVDHLHCMHLWPRLKIAAWLRPFEEACEAGHRKAEAAVTEIPTPV